MTMQNNGSVTGNALSDQPLHVQQLMSQQFASSKFFDGSGDRSWQQLLSKASPSVTPIYSPESEKSDAKFLDPALIQVLGNLLTQVVSALSKQKAAAPSQAKFLDALILQLIGGLVGQVANVVPKTDAPAGVSKADMNREYALGPGHYEIFPTWSFWGETNVRIVNTGAVPTTVLVNDQRFHLNPGEATTVPGKWAAFPVRVTNTSELPNSEVHVRVT
jgi:hypothetical protein